MFNQKTKTVGIISLVILLMSCAVLGLLLFLLDKKEEAFLKAVEERAQERAAEVQLKSLATLAEETSSERGAVEGYVLEKDGVISFLSLIESLGREQGLTVETTAIEVSPLGNDTTFETVSLTVQATGGYSDITNLLDVLETLPYQSSISRVSMQRRGTTGEWAGTFALSVTKFAN